MNSLTTLCKNIDVEAAAGYNCSLPIFPNLKKMSLDALPELERWAENSVGEPNNLVTFPQLEELHIANCNKISTLPESPALTRLSCFAELVDEVAVPMIIPLGSLPSLVSLTINGMLVDVVMPVNHQSQGPLDTLRNLDLSRDNGFMSMLNSSRLQLGLGDCLAFVEQLTMFKCNNIVFWPVEEFRCLVRLQSLGISWCEKLEGKGSSSSEEFLPLPQLKTLEIQCCMSLLEIPKLPDSLGIIQISECKSLAALPSNLGDLSKLRCLKLACCPELKALPDGMDGLTSLEELWIDSCPGITKFPQGLLQRLPALKDLHMWKCPDLQRRCREGGEYFDLVSPIPDVYIAPPDEPKTKRLVKRLLPWCGGGSSSS